MFQSRFPIGYPTAGRAVAALGVLGLALWGCGRGQSLTSPCTSIAAREQPLLDSALAVHRRHAMQLIAIPGVVGTGVGLTPDCHPAIIIFTQHAGVVGLPESLEGVPVEVQVTGEIVAL